MIKIFLDFDNTLVNSTKAYCHVYNKMHNTKAHWQLIRKWDMKDQCPLNTKEGLENIFGSQDFFDVLEFYKGMKNMVKGLSQNKELELFIVSKGNDRNLALKREWILKNLPQIKQDNIILLCNKDGMDKSSVDMEGGILVDDNSECLLSSNASYQIVFSHNAIKTEWNELVFDDLVLSSDARNLYEEIMKGVDFIKELEKEPEVEWILENDEEEQCKEI